LIDIFYYITDVLYTCTEFEKQNYYSFPNIYTVTLFGDLNICSLKLQPYVKKVANCRFFTFICVLTSGSLFMINPLKTNFRLLYLKIQSVPRC